MFADALKISMAATALPGLAVNAQDYDNAEFVLSKAMAARHAVERVTEIARWLKVDLDNAWIGDIANASFGDRAMRLTCAMVAHDENKTRSVLNEFYALATAAVHVWEGVEKSFPAGTRVTDMEAA